MLMCVIGRVMGGDYDSPLGVAVGVLVIACMLLLLLAGVVAGFVAMWRDGKPNLRETVAIAYLGIFLSGGGLIFFTALLLRYAFLPEP